MFHVPSNPSRPGWEIKPMFLTEATGPLLVAHVTSSQNTRASGGFWGFAHPKDLENLIDGISKSQECYELSDLCLLLSRDMGVASITSEKVTRVVTNSRENHNRIYMVITSAGGSYFLGDELTDKTLLNVILYKNEPSEGQIGNGVA